MTVNLRAVDVFNGGAHDGLQVQASAVDDKPGVIALRGVRVFFDGLPDNLSRRVIGGLNGIDDGRRNRVSVRLKLLQNQRVERRHGHSGQRRTIIRRRRESA